jgi:hypothetical protein
MDEFPIKSWLRSPGPITIISLTAAYVIAYSIDTALKHLREYAGTTFNFRPAILLSLVVPVVVISGIFALARLAWRLLPLNRFTAFCFIISGLFVVGEFLSIFVGFPLWLRTTILGRFRYALMDFGVQSSIYYLASGCIIIGITALWRLAVKPRNSSQGS